MRTKNECVSKNNLSRRKVKITERVSEMKHRVVCRALEIEN